MLKSFLTRISILTLGLAACTPYPMRDSRIEAPSCPYGEVVVSKRGTPPDPFKDVVHANFCPDLSHQLGKWQGTWVVNKAGQNDNQGWYCRYRWVPDASASKNPYVRKWNAPPAPLAPFAGLNAQVDCPLVSTQQAGGAPPLPQNYWKPLEANYRKQAGYVPTLPALARSAVTVAVVDTAQAPFTSSQQDNSPHGRTVGRVIDDLACRPGVACPVQIVNHLALRDLGSSTSDASPGATPGGGFFGTRGQVGEAINAALAAWVRTVGPGAHPSRLVINLSLGWPEELDRNPHVIEGKRTIPNDLVWQSLRRASCLGALVVAAAGNGIGPYQIGPLTPAAWEAFPAPTPAECAALLPPNWPLQPTADPEPSYRPLVYAAAAVDFKDDPLPTARPGSLPSLVADGLAVITADPLRIPYNTALLTGSSMATAVVSGIAATAWSYAPAMSAHQIMALVQRTAVPTTGPRPVELCLGNCAGRKPARVSQCGSLRGVPLQGNVVLCDTVPDHAGIGPTMLPSTLPPTPPPPRCDADHVCAGPGTPPPPPRDEPWVMPQPVPYCPACRIKFGQQSLDGTIPVGADLMSLGVSWADLYEYTGGLSAPNLDVNVHFNALMNGSFSAIQGKTVTTASVVLHGFWMDINGGSGDLPIDP